MAMTTTFRDYSPTCSTDCWTRDPLPATPDAGGGTAHRRDSQIFFSKLAEGIGDGSHGSRRRRSVSNRLPAKAIAHGVDGAIGSGASRATPGSGATGFIFKSKR